MLRVVYKVIITLVLFGVFYSAGAINIIVTNTLDSGPGSLRDAINTANLLAGTDSIHFAIPTMPYIIAPGTDLPPITSQVVIDGYSQFGSWPASSTAQASITVEVNGNNGALTGFQFIPGSGGSVIKGLSIVGFNVAGIHISEFNITVAGCRIGMLPDGVTGMGNGTGILLDISSSNCMIGGMLREDRNLISSNGTGIDINGGYYNMIQQNFIGTDTTGVTAVGNIGDGIFIHGGAFFNYIGAFNAGNIISGNQYGVEISDINSSDNYFSYNKIGTDRTGTMAVPNTADGIWIRNGADNNNIGGSGQERNIISGNGYSGIEITQSSGTIITGNYIGTDMTGSFAVANGITGVLLDTASNNTIGDAISSPVGNLISGHSDSGVKLMAGSSGNVVRNNKIGTDRTGTFSIPNGTGVIIEDAPGNTVGGGSGFDNIISGNAVGVAIYGANSQFNMVSANMIGVDSTGTMAIPNAYGVGLDLGASNNNIGDGLQGIGNVISGNDSVGVIIVDQGTDNNFVTGNKIGTDIGGSFAIPNTYGVMIYNDAANNRIGGVASTESNVISGNDSINIAIAFSSDSNKIMGNMIGTDASGMAVVNPNTLLGVFIADAAYNTIGANTVVSGNGSGNVISGHASAGVGIWGWQSMYNVVIGNKIGTDFTGMIQLPNNMGVSISDGAVNRIGGTATGEGNLISGNDSSGVDISGSGAFANMIYGNIIGMDLGGNTSLANRYGISAINGADSTYIGGLQSAKGNMISGNDSVGIQFYSTGPSGSLVMNNVIGLSSIPQIPLSNYIGVAIDDASSITVRRNTISGNNYAGIIIAETGATDNIVQGNNIGTDSTGMMLIPNGNGVGIYNGAYNNQIGDDLGIEYNLISGNVLNGIELSDIGTSFNTVIGNFIGTDYTGTFPLPNNIGININSGASDNLIGPATQTTATLSYNLISGNSYAGVLITDPFTTDNKIAGNIIGLESSGNVKLPNAIGVGIAADADANIVGGFNTFQGNVISGNDTAGVVIADPGTSGNRVLGNKIGTNTAGNDTLGNFLGVALMNGAGNNSVGSVNPAGANLISGNTVGVLAVDQGTTQDTIAGNYIGLDVSGNASLPNNVGVAIASGAAKIVVRDNVISGNNTNGVELTDAGTDSNYVFHNKIGTDPSGTVAMANGSSGISIGFGAQKNVIGGNNMINKANLISGNTDFGIEMTDQGTNYNVVIGNYIGTDVTGTLAIPNNHGIGLGDRVSLNRIGEDNTQSFNLISGNDSAGVWLSDTCSFNTVRGNLIGTDINGLGALPNLAGVVLSDRASWNTIGGQNQWEGNLVSGNDSVGILIDGNGTSANGLSNNLIGVDITANAALPNLTGGVLLSGGCDLNTVGGILKGNLISGNYGNGVTISDPGTNWNYVYSNFIGINTSVSATIPNLGHGVALLNNSGLNIVGGASPGQGNFIGGNDSCGILDNSNGGNTFKNNIIGVDTTGSVNLGNGLDGIKITGSSFFGNVVGDSVVGGASNYIAYNGGAGIRIAGDAGNRLFGNVTFLNNGLGIDLNPSGVTPNDPGDGDNGSNGLQNHPVINQVYSCSGGTTVIGTISSQPNRQYWIEIFDVGPVVDISGYGEAIEFIGTGIASTDASGTGTFFIQMPGVSPTGAITSTATDIAPLTARNTSEYGPNFPSSVFSTLPPPPAAGNDTAYCINAAVVPLWANGLDSSVTLYWYTDTTLAPIDSGMQFVPPMTTGTTTYYVTQNLLGCESYSTPVTISIDSLNGVMSSATDTVCFGMCTGDLAVNVTGGTAPYTYNWSTGDLGPVILNLCGGSYSVSVSDATGCSGTFTGVIVENPVPTIDSIVFDSTICAGQCSNLSFQFGGNGPFDLNYSDGTNTYTLNNQTTGSTTQLCPSTSTTYTMLSLNDAAGCVAGNTGQTITVVVNTIPPVPHIFNPVDTYCEGDTIRPLTSGFASVGMQLEWYDDPGLTQLLAVGDTLIPSLVPGDNSIYAILNNGGCIGPDTVINIQMVTANDVNAGADQTICIGDSIQLDASGGVMYQWFPDPTLSDTLRAAPVAYPQDITVYYVWITTQSGCGFQDSVTVTVDATPGCGFQIFNGFTPNNDGQNDVWHIDGIELFSSNSVMIFNRWGRKIRYFDNYDNKNTVWKGFDAKGNEIPDGTYYYVIRLGDKETMTGWVQLTR